MPPLATTVSSGPTAFRTEATAAAVVRNPWIGTGPGHDLSDEVARMAPGLARLLTDRLIAALGGVDAIEALTEPDDQLPG